MPQYKISIKSYYKHYSDNTDAYGTEYTELYTQTFTTTNLMYVSGIIELWQRYLHTNYTPVFQDSKGIELEPLSFGVDFHEAVVAVRYLLTVIQKFVATIDVIA